MRILSVVPLAVLRTSGTAAAFAARQTAGGGGDPFARPCQTACDSTPTHDTIVPTGCGWWVVKVRQTPPEGAKFYDRDDCAAHSHAKVSGTGSARVMDVDGFARDSTSFCDVFAADSGDVWEFTHGDFYPYRWSLNCIGKVAGRAMTRGEAMVYGLNDPGSGLSQGEQQVPLTFAPDASRHVEAARDTRTKAVGGAGFGCASASIGSGMHENPSRGYGRGAGHWKRACTNRFDISRHLQGKQEVYADGTDYGLFWDVGAAKAALKAWTYVLEFELGDC